jgi:hypothetical protein
MKIIAFHSKFTSSNLCVSKNDLEFQFCTIMEMFCFKFIQSTKVIGTFILLGKSWKKGGLFKVEFSCELRVMTLRVMNSRGDPLSP